MAYYWLTVILAFFCITSVKGQINTACTTSAISTFTPCFNYITGSSPNGSVSNKPTAQCCDSFRSLMSNSRDCVCLVVAANVPLALPINRTLALSLPRACNMGGVPLQCKAAGAPLPAPGPSLLGPSPSPMEGAPGPLSPQASKAVAEAPAASPPEEAQPMAPASPPLNADAPTLHGIRPTVVHPESSSSSLSPTLLLMFIGFMIF